MTRRALSKSGVGHQIALAPKVVLTPPPTPTYSNAWLVSSRVEF